MPSRRVIFQSSPFGFPGAAIPCPEFVPGLRLLIEPLSGVISLEEASLGENARVGDGDRDDVIGSVLGLLAGKIGVFRLWSSFFLVLIGENAEVLAVWPVG